MIPNGVGERIVHFDHQLVLAVLERSCQIVAVRRADTDAEIMPVEPEPRRLAHFSEIEGEGFPPAVKDRAVPDRTGKRGIELRIRPAEIVRGNRLRENGNRVLVVLWDGLDPECKRGGL